MQARNHIIVKTVGSAELEVRINTDTALAAACVSAKIYSKITTAKQVNTWQIAQCAMKTYFKGMWKDCVVTCC